MELHTVAILGTGTVARALAPRLAAAGLEVALWGRDRGRTAELARAVGLPALADLGGARDRDLALLCVTDRAVAELAGRLAAAGPAAGVALHTSGFHGAEVLAPLRTSGWSVGGLHPLASFPPGRPEETRLAGAWYALAGDGRARAAGRALIALLDGRELALDDGARAAYHAAAALAAGGLVALIDLALETLGDAAPRDDARRALAHLCAGVLDNVADLGTAAALAGPVPRGDVAVVEGHRAVLPPAARPAYRALLARMVELARARGADPAALEAIARLAAGE